MTEQRQGLTILHYVNQFFAGIGGEEQADQPPELRPGPIGPGRVLARLLDGGLVTSTLVCGDNYFQDHRDEAAAEVRRAIEKVRPDVVIAGPAFLAGRYGLACGEVCRIAEAAGVTAVAGMHAENPAAAIYSQQVYVASTGPTPVAMEEALRTMVRLATKLAVGHELGPAAEEGYLPRGVRKQGERDRPGAERAIDMLVAKLNGRPFVSEIPYQPVDRVAPAPPLRDPSSSSIALITTGGLIQKGNPDHMTSSNARRYLRFEVGDLDELTNDQFEAYHAGYYNSIASTDPNYILPLRYARMLEAEGAIRQVHPSIYALPGVSTPVAWARRLGAEIAQELHQADVGGALLVAT
ncbi:MAG: glycine/betaine/sarcosine/D-proline family reductase selenoprotein B [Chloroflexi bacterium]|nr:glycine/betaine/sarcosine/D-proline family reductase selenoprotein B [Chloroflexota bacterium]